MLIHDGIQSKIASERFPLGTYLRGRRHKITADSGTCFIDGTGRVIFFPHQERAAMKITSVVGRNQMVSYPHGVFVFDNRHNIRSSLPLPTKNVFIPDIGNKVGEAAFPAAAAKLTAGRIIQVHVFLC